MKSLILNGIMSMVRSGQDPTELILQPMVGNPSGLNNSRKFMQCNSSIWPGSSPSRRQNLVTLLYQEKYTVKGLWNLPLQVKKAAEARHVTRESLSGGQEWPLHEAVTVKPGLHWILQDIRDARAVGSLLRELQTGH